MLFRYRYVTHPIEHLQSYLDHLVTAVWCNPNGKFSLGALQTGLQDIINDIYNAEDGAPIGNGKDWLYGPIEKIYNLFATLDDADRQRIVSWYHYNNDVEALCACDPRRTPGTYADLRHINADLASALKEFCTSLYTDVIGLKAVRSRLGGIDAHYAAFLSANDEGKCPYCGYNDIRGLHRETREAYDHFFPKSVYPFNTVNFRNLAPMCHECNHLKLAKDPTRHVSGATPSDAGARTRAFYSYASATPSIAIDMTLDATSSTMLEPNYIDLRITSPGCEEEVASWKAIFQIEERYKAKLCAKNDGRAWLQQTLDEAANFGLASDTFVDRVLRVAEKAPFVDANFLKKPFLAACKRAGLFAPSDTQ